MITLSSKYAEWRDVGQTFSANSFFANCPRDEKGHCMSAEGGGGGGGEPKKPQASDNFKKTRGYEISVDAASKALDAVPPAALTAPGSSLHKAVTAAANNNSLEAVKWHRQAAQELMEAASSTSYPQRRADYENAAGYQSIAADYHEEQGDTEVQYNVDVNGRPIDRSNQYGQFEVRRDGSHGWQVIDHAKNAPVLRLQQSKVAIKKAQELSGQKKPMDQVLKESGKKKSTQNSNSTHLISLVANLRLGVRRVVQKGKTFLVAKATLIVPGVLNGSRGPLYYPPNEIARNYEVWDGVPVVLNHPTKDGQPVSAHDDGVYEDCGLGVLRNVELRARDGALQAEAWFEEERVRRVSPRILNALLRGSPLELSTGLYTDNVPAPAYASHNGVPYGHVAKNYRPDHLAILPDQTGACSLKDGCGILVNTSAESTGWIDLEVVNGLSVKKSWVDVANCGGPGSGVPGPCPGDKSSSGAPAGKSFKELEKATGAQGNRATRKAAVAKLREQLKVDPSALGNLTGASEDDAPREFSKFEKLAGTGFVLLAASQEAATKVVEEAINPDKPVDDFTSLLATSLSMVPGLDDKNVSLFAAVALVNAGPPVLHGMVKGAKWLRDKLAGRGKGKTTNSEDGWEDVANCGGPGSGVPGPCPGWKKSGGAAGKGKTATKGKAPAKAPKEKKEPKAKPASKKAPKAKKVKSSADGQKGEVIKPTPEQEIKEAARESAPAPKQDDRKAKASMRALTSPLGESKKSRPEKTGDARIDASLKALWAPLGNRFLPLSGTWEDLTPALGLEKIEITNASGWEPVNDRHERQSHNQQGQRRLAQVQRQGAETALRTLPRNGGQGGRRRGRGDRVGRGSTVNGLSSGWQNVGVLGAPLGLLTVNCGCDTSCQTCATENADICPLCGAHMTNGQCDECPYQEQKH